MPIKFEITGDNSNLLHSLDGARNGVNRAAKEIEQSGMGIEDMFKRIAAAAGIAFSIGQAKQFAKSVMDVRGQFQQMEIAFSTMLQSEEKAQKLMSQLVETAAKTPFDLKGVAEGAKQLLAYGIAADEVNETITKLGDIAAGLSIPLGDLVYLYGTTITQGRMFTMDLRQFMGRGIPMAEELAKQFGVAKNEVAGLVTAGKVSADAVKKAIWSMTAEGSKFGGLMAKQSASITGQISNIEDAFDSMLNEIGKKSEGVINSSLSVVSALIENYDKIGKVLLQLISIYGSYKVAVMTNIALEKIQAFNRLAHIKGVTAMQLVTDILTKKTAALNAVLMANPYVMLATVVMSAVAAYTIFGGKVDEATQAQKRLNDIKDEAAEKVEEEKDKIEELQKVAKSEQFTLKARQDAINQLNSIIPNYNAQLDATTGKYIENKKALDDYLVSLARKYELEGAKDQLRQIGKEIAQTRIEITKATKSVEDTKKLQSNVGKLTAYNQAESQFVVANTARAEKDLDNANKKLSIKLKERQLIYDTFGEEMRNEVAGVTGNQPEDKKGGGKGGTTKTDKEDTTAKQIQLDRELEEMRGQARIEAANAAREAYIASIKDNTKREIEQERFEHEKRKQEILLQAEEMRKARYEANKKQWELNNKGSYELTQEGQAGWKNLALSEDQQTIINSMLEKENLEYARLVQQRYDNERQATLDFLKEYGDYEQQKLAITEEYEKRIAEAATPSEAASLTMKRNEELEKLGSEKLLDSIDWQGVFNDLSGHTEEYLEGLRDQLQDLLKTGDLPVDQMATIQEKITEINEAINEQGGMFKYASEQQQEHIRRLKEAEDAQKLLNAAKEEEARASMEVFTITQQIRDYLAQIGVDSDVDLDDGLIESLGANSEEAKKLADMLKKLRVAQGNYTKAGEESRKKLFNWRKAEDSLNEGWEDAVARVAGNISGWMETYLSDLPDLLSSIGLGGVGEKVSKGMSGISNVAGAAADYASGNYVGAALKAVSAIKDFGSALGIGAGNEAEVARTTEELTKQNELLGNKIEALTEQLSKAYGANAIRVYNDALEAQEKQNKNVMDILKAQMGYHSAHHSNEYYMNDREIRGYNESAQKAFQSAGVTASTINGLTSIYNLTPEQLKAIRDFAPDLWRYLTETGKYDKSEYWDNVVEQAGKTAELTKQIRETLTTTTEENVFSDFLNSLYDLADGSEEVFDNIAEDWRKMVNQMVINNLVGSKFQEDLKGWYEELARINQQMVDGNMSEEWYRDQMANMKNLYDGYVESAQQEINRLRDAGIIQSIAKEEEEALEDVEEEVNKHLDTIRSSFQRLISDTTIDIDKWSKDMRNSILQNLMESKLLDEAFDQWAAQWSDRYASLLDEMTEGAIDQQMFDKQMQGLMYEFDQRTDEVADKARQMWEAFHLGIDEASDTTFKDMGGEFQNALMNLDGTAEDWGKNVGQKMAQRIIEQMVNARMLQPFLDDLQNAFDQAMSVEGVTIDSVLADLAPQIEAAKDAFEEAQPVAQRILSAFGITKKPTMPFSDLRSTFVSTLMDMEADAVSFSKSINRTLTEQMVSRLVEKKYQSQIDALNESWRQALEEGSPARIAEVRKSITDLYEEMGRDEEIKKLRDDLVELKNDGDDTFSSLSDSWTSALMNLDSTAEDWGTEIGQTLAQKIISEMIVGKKLQPYLDDIQQAFDNAFGAEGATPESVIESVKPFIKGAQEAYDNMKPYVNSILDMLEVSSYPDQQAHVNMADKATYDQFELYLGMQTAMMIGQEQGNAVRQQILSTLQAMAGITSPQNDYGSQIFMRLGTTNEYLLDIKKSNKDIFESFGMKLDSINQKLSRL